MKKWEYVKNSFKMLKAPPRAIELVESIEEQLEVYDLNKNATGWKYEGECMVVGDLFDLKCVLLGEDDYCYCCESYSPHCIFCPFNSPSTKGCSRELDELLTILFDLDELKLTIFI